jgi:rare lipoprotein A (peptidoglycan hydrolase)
VTHLQKDYGSQVARLLWAAQRTAAMEDLADRQRRERLALTHANAMEWLPWLERQAALGNEAAIAALRGLRYRAQRDKNKHKAGIEGEDLGHPSFGSQKTASGARYDPTTLTSAPPNSGSHQSTALNTLTPLARYD